MRRLALIFTTAALLALPASAHAEWWFTKQGAQRIARDSASKRYGEDYGVSFGSMASSCRPQNDRFDPSYKYHRWVCGWADSDYDGDMCSGTLLIIGSRDVGSYYSRVMRGARCFTS